MKWKGSDVRYILGLASCRGESACDIRIDRCIGPRRHPVATVLSRVDHHSWGSFQDFSMRWLACSNRLLTALVYLLHHGDPHITEDIIIPLRVSCDRQRTWQRRIPHPEFLVSDKTYRLFTSILFHSFHPSQASEPSLPSDIQSEGLAIFASLVRTAG